MIYTLTLNPAIDYYMEISGDLMQEEVNRGRHERFKAAGKGLNVSRDLSIMNIPSVAVAVLGGFTGAYIENVFSADRNIRFVTVPVEGNNRVNVKLHDHGRLIAVNGEGPYAHEKEKEAVKRVLAGAGERDMCVISGSCMRGFDDAFIIDLCDMLHEHGVKIVLDNEKLTLDTLTRCRPDLIKPNLYELGLLTGEKEPSPENAVSMLEKARDAGLSGILLSMGKKGGILMDGKRMYRMSHPETDLVNKVGTGDAMLAAYIGKIQEGVIAEDALRWAGAMGNAVGYTMDEATLEDVMELFDDITVTVIEE